jgi:prepilin-type N-terminal cleavage/methylation domain-containing protein/prepilin-type processing-associated H-X9-DG protein
MPKNAKRGFTLIELLVVIAIIAILAAILFPVFARARENARRASCQSNLKQIALGVFMYNQDYDERLPQSSVGSTAPYSDSNPYGWADALQPYLKSTQIFQCPSETGGPNANVTYGLYTDYWINSLATGKSDATFDAPAVTVLLGDGQSGSAAAASAGDSRGAYIGSARYTSGGTAQTCPSTAKADIGTGAHRHLTGANIAFADGHVKWEKGVSDSSNVLSAVYNSCYGTSHGNPTFRLSDSDL